MVVCIKRQIFPLPPPLPPPISPSKQQANIVSGIPSKIINLTSNSSRQLLNHSVMNICAHIGFQYSQESCTTLLTDITHEFLTKFCKQLCYAQDKSNEGTSSNNFNDVLDDVCLGTGIGSIRDLGKFYESRIKLYDNYLSKEANELSLHYENLKSIKVNPEPSVYSHDEEILSIPELHVSSLDGRGAQMEMGLHMLNSLEQGSEVLKDSSMKLGHLA